MRDQNGVLRAIVRDTRDPSDLGRVKLNIPSFDPNYLTGWVPIASPMTGPSRGFFYSPEVGDEALLAFDNGEIDHPYVIGFLYNGQQKPPETERKNRVILTPGGNTLRFEDKDDAKKVILKTSGGYVLEMDESEDAQKISLSDASGESITLTVQDGKIKIQAESKVVVEAPKVELVDEGATHPLVFGDVLLRYLDTTLNTALQTHLHPGQMALGILPVTPAPPVVPFPQATSAINSQKATTG
jgi:uncharacterized protein involved in type VI secretion and phage assembly